MCAHVCVYTSGSKNGVSMSVSLCLCVCVEAVKPVCVCYTSGSKNGVSVPVCVCGSSKMFCLHKWKQ